MDWAHPGFGKQLIATCSQDRTVKIWVGERAGGWIVGVRLGGALLADGATFDEDARGGG